MANIFTRKVRLWIYGVLLAAFPVVCIYRPELTAAAPLWLALALAILNLTPTDVTTKDEVLAKHATLDADEQNADIEAATSRQQ